MDKTVPDRLAWMELCTYRLRRIFPNRHVHVGASFEWYEGGNKEWNFDVWLPNWDTGKGEHKCFHKWEDLCIFVDLVERRWREEQDNKPLTFNKVMEEFNA